MPHSLNPSRTPLSRKRTERLSPEPGEGNPPESKKLRRVAPAQSFADVLKEMPVNGSPSPVDTNVDNLLEEALVFQYVDIQRHPKDLPVVLIFGVTEARSLPATVHILQLNQYLRRESESSSMSRSIRLSVVCLAPVRRVDTFLQNYKIKAMTWMEIPPSRFEPVEDHERLSHNQVEFFCSVRSLHLRLIAEEDIIFHSPEGPWAAKSAPLRILSFDIEEMVAPNAGFPRYDHEPIIQIGNMLAIKGDPHPYSRCIFTLNTCSRIEGAQVRSFNHESTMLRAWRDFVVETDPDLIVGFNIGAFDFPQLILRAKTLGLVEFAYLGRLKAVPATAELLAVNKRSLKDAPILAGRLQLDLLQHLRESNIKRTTKELTLNGRPKCDLNTVSWEFLGQRKEEIHHMKINPLQQGGPEDRRQLAVYCLKDTHLPLLLLECPELRCLDESIDAARTNKYHNAFHYHARFARALRWRHRPRQTGTPPVLCTTGSCWTSPDNATDHGCTNQWAGGVDAWATCGFEGAIICNACLACSTNATAAGPGCYTSPTQAEGTGCVSWAGGVDAWNTCGFEGAAAHVFITDFLKKKGIPTLDVLVNNAAIGSESFKETFDVNVVGTVAVTEAFRPLLTKAKDDSGGGAILNISSGLGSINAYAKGTAPLLPVPAYSAGKAALNSLTAQWALQEKEKKSGIRVVSICPGFNATRLNGYTGTSPPSEGCKVIVKAALETDGRTGVFFNKDEDLEW
ncbi:ribonuclease H-like domain-containing protein [Mycena olivaceomarginata]|nr:ribonuclease H-like domain-containing protein [Mycena olivaceomarginata]